MEILFRRVRRLEIGLSEILWRPTLSPSQREKSQTELMNSASSVAGSHEPHAPLPAQKCSEIALLIEIRPHYPFETFHLVGPGDQGCQACNHWVLTQSTCGPI